MDASNASVYDGATAAAEAAAHVPATAGRHGVVLVSAAAHPAGASARCRPTARAAAVAVAVAARAGRRAPILPMLAAATSGRQRRPAFIVQQPQLLTACSKACDAACRRDRTCSRRKVHHGRRIPFRPRRSENARPSAGPISRWAKASPLACRSRIRRPVPGIHGLHARSSCRRPARPHRGRDHGSRRADRCFVLTLQGPRAAHPPREGVLQHLLQRGALRHDRLRSTWPPWGRRASRRAAEDCARPMRIIWRRAGRRLPGWLPALRRQGILPRVSHRTARVEPRSPCCA